MILIEGTFRAQLPQPARLAGQKGTTSVVQGRCALAFRQGARDMPIRIIADPFARQIGERIRDIRLEQGKSLTAMEAASGVSKGHLSNIERGQVLMNVVTLRNIARALGMRLADLVAGLE